MTSNSGGGMRMPRKWILAALAVLIAALATWFWWNSTMHRVDLLVQEAAKGAGVDPIFEWGRSGVEIDADFRRLGPAAVPPLIDFLGSPDSSVRRVAARQLGLLGDRRAVPALMAVLTNDSDQLVRRTAAGALGDIGDSSALPALVMAMDDPDWRMRAAAAEAMGGLKTSGVVASLFRALKDPVPWVRAPAAAALGRIRTDSAAEALIPLLGDDQEWVRCEAAIALARMGRKEGLPELLSALRDKGEPAPSDRVLIVHLLGELGDLRAEDALRRLAESDRLSDVRAEAEKALSRLRENQHP